MEEAISLKEAARLWTPAKSTQRVRVYARSGLVIGDITIKLGHKWSGGRIYTTRSAVLEFQQQCQQARERLGL